MKLLTRLLLTLLSLYAAVGYFAYPIADDTAFIELAHQQNPLLQQYYGWQGRYGYSILMGSVLPAAPTVIVKLFPTLLISLMTIIGYGLLKKRTRRPLLASAGLAAAFLMSLPSVWQSVMWYGASTNYVAPLICGGLLLLWLV